MPQEAVSGQNPQICCSSRGSRDGWTLPENATQKGSKYGRGRDPESQHFLSPGIRQCLIPYECPSDLIRLNGIGIPSKTITNSRRRDLQKTRRQIETILETASSPFLNFSSRRKRECIVFLRCCFFPIWGGILRFCIAGSGNVKTRDQNKEIQGR